MLNQTCFDLWADGYDQSVGLSDESDTYPFAGYKQVLGEIYDRVLSSPGRRVLDIGFGTATLTAKLYAAGCTIDGQDFSPRMLALAREKMPKARLYPGDFTQGLVAPLREEPYDAIIATYSLHHLTDSEKIPFLRSLLPLLSPGGRIYIGDVAFPNREALQNCQLTAGEEWDEDEFYFVYDELRPHFSHSRFTPCSHCAGLLELWQDAPEIRVMDGYDEAAILSLYRSVGWSNYTERPEMLRAAFGHSLLTLGAYEGGHLLGLLRCVGDGASIVYVQDLLVDPQHQRRGIGRRLLQALMAQYPQVYQMILSTDSTAENLGFYQSCGFVPLTSVNCQSLMWVNRTALTPKAKSEG